MSRPSVPGGSFGPPVPGGETLADYIRSVSDARYATSADVAGKADKGSYSLSVKDYGANPASTDNSSAFQAAVNAAAPFAEIYVPAGDYIVATPPNLGTKKIIWTGPGRVSTSSSFNSSSSFRDTLGGFSYSMGSQPILRTKRAAPDDSQYFRVSREARLAGGTSGFVTKALMVETTTSADNTNYEWNAMFQLNDYASIGTQNCGFYVQSLKYGTGATFGGVIEVQDRTGTQSSGVVALEIDVTADGDNSNNNRLGLDVLAFPYDDAAAAANPPQFYRGVHVSGKKDKHRWRYAFSTTASWNGAAFHAAQGVTLGSTAGDKSTYLDLSTPIGGATAGIRLEEDRHTDGTGTATVRARLVRSLVGTDYQYIEMRSGSTQEMRLGVGMGEAIRISSANRVVVGGAAADPQSVAGVNTYFQSHGVGNNLGGGTFANWFGDASAPITLFGKSRGGAVGTHGLVSSGDVVADFRFAASDGAAWGRIGGIQATVEGTPAAGVTPGRLTFSTTGQASSTPTERMRLDSKGNVAVGGTAALATTATDGFLYIPTVSGTPTATPSAFSGRAPIALDSTGLKLWVYIGGAWKSAALA